MALFNLPILPKLDQVRLPWRIQGTAEGPGDDKLVRKCAYEQT